MEVGLFGDLSLYACYMHFSRLTTEIPTMCRCENGEEQLHLCHADQTQLEERCSVSCNFFLIEQEGCFESQVHQELDSNFDELKRWPTFNEILEELKTLSRITGPMILMSLLLYSRGMISMLFLGYLGELELAGGSLAIGFANITGYSVISGLAMGMEPICGQAFGAKRWSLLGLTLQRTVLMLLSAAIPIGVLWWDMEPILQFFGQDKGITAMAGTYIVFSLPDLITQAFLHPLRIYLRAQNITLPLTFSAAFALVLHAPVNFLLVVYLNMGIKGVALAAVWTNFNIVVSLLCYLCFSGVYKKSWQVPSKECVKEWRSLLSLALPSCASVCLEWWWYEFMIILCGLLLDPKATLASVGILIQTTSLLYIFPSSLSLGVSTRVGNELGANRPDKARITMIVGIACAVLLSFISLSFTVTMRDRWGRIFTNDGQILSLVSAALPILGLCELGNCPQTTGCGVLRGSAQPNIGANINLASFYVIGMPVAIIMGFVFKFEFVGLWLGLLAAQASCVTLMFYVLMRTDWTQQAQRAKQLTAIGGSMQEEKPQGDLKFISEITIITEG